METKEIFKPELLNRFDDIITFKPLGQAEIMEIVKLLLKEVINKLDAKRHQQSILMKKFSQKLSRRDLIRILAQDPSGVLFKIT